MENILELRFNHEDSGNCRTYYKGNYVGKDKKYNIVILHEDHFDEICTASNDGEPEAPLKKGLKILLNNKLYIVADRSGYSVLEEIKDEN